MVGEIKFGASLKEILKFLMPKRTVQKNWQKFILLFTAADRTGTGVTKKTDREKRRIDRDFCADLFLTAVKSRTSWEFSQKTVARIIRFTKEGSFF